MGGSNGTLGRISCRVLVEESEERLGRIRRAEEENIKMNL
jgi:hypothetical protein